MSVHVLMVAEKPILAESIARILSSGSCETRKGSNGACSISTYKGRFNNLSAIFKVTSTCGHVMGVDFPGKFNAWHRTDPAELFNCPIEHIEANPKLRMPAFLASVAKGCDYLVLWLDCDKEGENICFEVIDAVQNSMKPSRSNNFLNVVYRARFSAVTEKEIKDAMRNLVRPNLNESLSVDARQELDLRIGCAFTRFQTKFFQEKYGDLDSNLISFGPCQTPTLAFCVVRHDEIVNFKPQPYWLLQAEIELPGGGRTLKLEWARDRQFDKNAAQSFLKKIKNAKHATVVEISDKEHKKEKPVALNTVELLKVASSYLGLGPSSAMSVAEFLYTRGYTSYPRTETTAYPESFDFYSILKQIAIIPEFADFALKIMQNGISKPRAGVNKGDHPPITPLKAKDSWLSGGDINYILVIWIHHLRIYEYIVQHFLATLMPSCKYLTKTIKFSIGEEQFLTHSRVVTEPGFTELLTWMAVSQDETFDQIKKGQNFEIKEVKMVERITTPPEYLTESELISLMEKYGIGTDASIPTHINNICTRNYVKIETGRKLVPTKLGIALVHGYQKIDADLVEPTMRANVEKQLNLIAEGKADYIAMKNSFKTLVESGKPFSKCGKCRRYMKLVEARPQRLYCPTCQEQYPVPSAKDASVRLHGEHLCPIDGFELLYFHPAGGKLAKSFAFCPHCYNNPPFEDMRGRHPGCNECSHPECQHSYISQGVLQCLTRCFGGRGTLVLDPQSGPKWRLSCNKCPAVVSIFEGASKLKVMDRCEKCGARKLSVEYKNAKTSKLPDQACNFVGCAFCEQHNLGECVNFRHAFLDKEPTIGGSRGTRGSRGGRGRGRGSTTTRSNSSNRDNVSSGRGGVRGRGTRGQSRGTSRGRGIRGGRGN
uniref:DNA topoisomerase n=1 Tax=Meloidogyne javanica TaxID=6303 RepID=A0A915M5C6_MELJA